MKWKMQCKENLHELNGMNYPIEIKNEVLLPDDEEYHRGMSKIDDVLSYIESHCNTRQKSKQKYKRYLREEEKICIRNKNMLLDIIQIEECVNLPQMLEKIERCVYVILSWMRIPSVIIDKQSEFECIVRIADEIRNPWMRIPKREKINIDIKNTWMRMIRGPSRLSNNELVNADC